MENESTTEAYFSQKCTQPPSIFKHIENDRPDLINSPGTQKPTSIQAQPPFQTKKHKLDCETIPISINYPNINLNSESDLDLAILTISASTATKPDPPHKCYNVLLGRRKLVRKQCDHVKIMTSIIKLPLKDYIPTSVLFDSIVLHWYRTTTTFTEKSCPWSMPQLAKYVCNFDDILIQATQVVDRIEKTPSPPIITFQSFKISL